MQVQSTGGRLFVTEGLRTANALRKTSKELEKLLDQLSTAKRITSAADDAAGLGISEQLTTQVRGFQTASQNISDATAMLTIADGAGQDVSELLGRQRELAVQAQNGTLSSNDRASLNTEYQAITQEIGRVSKVTNYNNQQITSGDNAVSKIQVGPNAGDELTVPHMDLKSIAKQIGPTEISTAEGANLALAAIDGAVDGLNKSRSTIGSTINRLTSAGDTLVVAMNNTQAAQSIIADEDMAMGLAKLTQQKILQEGALKTFGRFNELSKNHVIGLLE